jgi:hypothetical protein
MFIERDPGRPSRRLLISASSPCHSKGFADGRSRSPWPAFQLPTMKDSWVREQLFCQIGKLAATRPGTSCRDWLQVWAKSQVKGTEQERGDRVAHEMITEATMPNAAAVASIGHDTFKALTSEWGMVLRIVETHPITSSACSGFAREEI